MEKKKKNEEEPKEKKNEIRHVNPFVCYHDGRIEKFMEIFNEIYKNAIKYSKEKGNTFEYYSSDKKSQSNFPENK